MINLFGYIVLVLLNLQLIGTNILDDIVAIFNRTTSFDEGQIKSTNDMIKFYLFNKSNPQGYLITIEDLDQFPKIHHYKYIIHGWLENSERPWYKEIVNEFLKKNNFYSVILVDWRSLSVNVYKQAARSTKYVGQNLAQHILKSNIPLSNVHLIGHSLGAHIAGFVGKQIKRSTGGRLINRITALDPAGPLFEYPSRHVDEKLNKGDAEIVDVIHTDAGVFGYSGPIGLMDFYPNGGYAPQNGCYQMFIFNKEDVAATTQENIFCSHTRSIRYFAESINSLDFISKQCFNYSSYLQGVCDENVVNVMGENLITTLPGVFYLKTNSRKPYGRGF